MRKWMALGILSASALIAGCQGTRSANDPLLQLQDEEGALLTQAEGLANEAEALFADILPSSLSVVSPLAETERSFTLLADGEETVLIASLKRQPLPQSPGEIWGKPLNITIRCSSRGHCRVWIPVPTADESNHRMAWIGGMRDGSREEQRVNLVVHEWAGTGTPMLRQAWSYNKLGIGGFWADSRIQWPDITLHLLYELPTVPGQPFNGTMDLTRFIEGLRAACCDIPKPFEVEWPPALLVRGEFVLAFIPFQNRKLTSASSPEDLIGEPLGIAYLRQASGAKLTKADAARIVEVRLVREEPEWGLVATNLRNPSDTLHFRIGQVEWCDGCFGQDPPPGNPIPRRLAIEDRQEGPVLGLQVGNLILRGIEKKDIRR